MPIDPNIISILSGLSAQQGQQGQSLQFDLGMLAGIQNTAALQINRTSSDHQPSTQSSLTARSFASQIQNSSGPSQNSVVPATPAPAQGSLQSVREREEDIAGERVKRKNRAGKSKGKRVADEAFDELVTQSDEQQNRRLRESRWEHFLYGEQKDSRVDPVIRKIIGNNSNEDSKIYDEVRRQILQDHRRFQNETLNNALVSRLEFLVFQIVYLLFMKKFCRKMAENQEDSTSTQWEGMIDHRIEYNDNVLREKITAAFSWERFYQVWHWFRKYVDAESSKPMAKYYCRQLWIQVVLETVRYMRVKRKTPRETEHAQQVRITRYSALPSHDNFKKVCRDMFVEKSPGLKGTTRTKRQKLSTAKALAHVKMDAPPDLDENNVDGSGSGGGSGKRAQRKEGGERGEDEDESETEDNVGDEGGELNESDD
ncbi:hypothetical protein AAE478_001476 [Parahypoxylon ruwenzoriense]